MEGSIGDTRGLFPACFITKNFKMIGKVEYTYTAQRDDEISLQKGDVVEIFEDKGNWARVVCDSKGGFFPLACVKLQQPTPPSLASSKGASSGSIKIKKRKNPKGLGRAGTSSVLLEKLELATVIKAYEPQHPGDLMLVEGVTIELTKTKGAWWEGIYEGNKGIFPAKCVKKN